MNEMDMQGQARQSLWTGELAPHTVIGDRKNIKILSEAQYDKYGIRVEIMEYQALLGCTNMHSAQALWFMKEANIKCRQIALYVSDSAVKIESGAMSYFKGPLNMTSGIDSAGKLVSQVITGKLTGERIIMPEYVGSGLLVLEPSFKHFFVGELGPGESIICDKGAFYAASKLVKVEPCFAGGMSGSILGGEGVFQQKITGPGMIILELPVPMCEIDKIHLNNDILRVDGNFALLRTGNISMNVEKAGKSFVGSAASGEGLVNVFKGTGDVWVAPTIKVYDALRKAEIFGGEICAVDMNTSTGRAK